MRFERTEHISVHSFSKTGQSATLTTARMEGKGRIELPVTTFAESRIAALLPSQNGPPSATRTQITSVPKTDDFTNLPKGGWWAMQESNLQVVLVLSKVRLPVAPMARIWC